MKIKNLDFDGVFEIILDPKEDSRGFFMRTYDTDIFQKHNLKREWVQENHSFSKEKGVVRGLHFQFPPYAETKLVRVSSGETYAVFVDLRKNSKTFGRWGSMILSGKNKRMLYIPRGFAMGICTLTENCTLLYKMDNYYSPENQGEIKWDDKDIGIKWPVDNPILSKRDKNAISFKDFLKKFKGMEE